jgi:hypothetical protein
MELVYLPREARDPTLDAGKRASHLRWSEFLFGLAKIRGFTLSEPDGSSPLE